MSKTTHTPGPWSIYDYGEEEAPTLVIHKDSNTRVCFMAIPGSHGDPARIEKDAQLICAAPDLLKAAQMQEDAELNRPMDCEECGGEGEPEACGSCFPPFDDARVARRLAIAKALGKTA